jgi:subtilisin family serine protease
VFKALHDLAADGRQGLGTVVVQSAGNGYNYGDDTNLHNFQNSRYIITVGATDYFGSASYFSTTGASILVAAPGGAGYSNYASIITTDRTGSAGSTSGNTTFADGTSFSAPVVSGIVAMMLEVNPHLGYRDVQQILAYTAHQTDYSAGTVTANGATDWNGGGLQFIYRAQTTGFGQVDALAAVRLAASWDAAPQTVANTVEVTATQKSGKRSRITIQRASAAPSKSPATWWWSGSMSASISAIALSATCRSPSPPGRHHQLPDVPSGARRAERLRFEPGRRPLHIRHRAGLGRIRRWRLATESDRPDQGR